MNIAYFLHPKHEIAFLYDDFSFRQGLEKMRRHDYKAVPVISRDGRYVGTVSEGDFLWKILDRETEAVSMREMEHLRVQDILHTDTYPAVPITCTVEELVDSAMRQSFIPVVDDTGIFIGIVTRRDIIHFLSKKCAGVPDLY